MIQEKYYYMVKATWVTEDDKGKSKQVPETYLIEAVSPTDAEKIANDNFNNVTDFRVKSISEVKLNKIILSEK